MVSIGLIGCGRAGYMHLQNAASLSSYYQIKLTHLCNYPMTNQIQQIAQNYRIPNITTNIEEVFTDNNLDAVIIAGPTSTHSKCIELATKYKKHFLCENSVGIGTGQIMQSKRQTDEAGVIGRIAFNRRFDKTVYQAYKLVNEGHLGKIIKAYFNTSDDTHVLPTYFTTERNIFENSDVHSFDLQTFFIKSKPISIYAIGGNHFKQEYKDHGDYDTSDILIQFESNAVSYITNARYRSVGHEQRFEIFGTEKTIVVDNQPFDTLEFGTSQGTVKSPLKFLNLQEPGFYYRYKKSYYNMMNAFFKELVGQKNEVPLATLDDALNAMKLSAAALESARKSEVVFIN